MSDCTYSWMSLGQKQGTTLVHADESPLDQCVADDPALDHYSPINVDDLTIIPQISKIHVGSVLQEYSTFSC